MVLTQRLIAVMIIVIPGILAGYGWTLMRDAIFMNFSSSSASFPTFMFIGGLTLFILCSAFIAGFFIYRDKKKEKILLNRQEAKNPDQP